MPQTPEGRARMDAARAYSDDLDQQRRRPPYVPGSDTSEAAADSMIGPGARLRDAVYRLVLAAGANGITCDEAEAALDGTHQAVSPRFRELVETRRIVDSGNRRQTRSGRAARVYVRRLA